MIQQLIQILHSYDNTEYAITKEETKSIEVFFIKKQIEMQRTVTTTEYFLTLYTLFEEDGVAYRGSADLTIFPTDSEAEIIEKISNAQFAAQFVKNKYYPLPEKNTLSLATLPTSVTAHTIYDYLNTIVQAFYKADIEKDAYISYSEFFVSEVKTTFCNSNGVHYEQNRYRTEIETSVIACTEKEVEIYEAYQFSECEPTELTQKIQMLFVTAKEKSRSSGTKTTQSLDVLLSGECLKTFFSYYVQNSNAEAKVHALSTFEVGQPVALGNPLTIVLDPHMKGSTASALFDADGVVLSPQTIIADGNLTRFWGTPKDCYALGVPTTGTIHNMIVHGGATPIEKLCQGDHIELVSFSDFQLNAVTGDFGSEIRLGYVWIDGKKSAFTGGSISGNMKKVEKKMKLSSECMQYNDFIGPKGVLLCKEDVSLS